MSETELHVLRARLLGGIRNKAERGELHRGLPIGLIRGEGDGEVLLHPDESVRGAIRAVFERFTEMGSARRVWLWFRSQGLRFPLQSNGFEGIRWVTPTYTKIHAVLANPFYAGVYVYGKRFWSATWMTRAVSVGAFENALAKSGPSSSVSITKGTSPGKRSRRTSSVWGKIPDHAHITAEAP